MGKKRMISTAIAFAVITPLVCFTNILGDVPFCGHPILTKSYWSGLDANSESVVPSVMTIIVFAGPICILFLSFWHLWVQRNKQEEVLAVVVRSSEIHGWLGKWAESARSELSAELQQIAVKAQCIFRRLGRLRRLDDMRNWRWWYTLYLAQFYVRNAPAITAFMDVRTEPPVESWPAPEDAAKGLSTADRQLLQNAVEFSSDFTDGAKASTGLRFMLHTVTGGVTTFILAALLGGAFVLATIPNLGPWSMPVFASLSASLALGLLTGYFWQWFLNIRRSSSGE